MKQKRVSIMSDHILYITYRDYRGSSGSGAVHKIAGQCGVFQANGFRVDRVNPYGSSARLTDCGTGLFSQHASLLGKRWSVLRAVRAALAAETYAAAYIRFQFFSEDVRQLCRLLQKHGVTVLMEFPTYPYEGELRRQGLRGIPKLLCDRLFRHACAKYIDAFVTQAEAPSIWGVRCIQVLNGLDFTTRPMRVVSPAPEAEIHMAAVASMLPWHGYDRLLAGMTAYYHGGERELRFVLHLIGEGPELAKYRSAVRENRLQSHVIFHGTQSGDALQAAVSQCHLAIGSLGAHRIGLKKLSTLKSREYCAWGLPSVNATATDILSAGDPFCLYVPEGEAPVDMEAVARFYRRVYFLSDLSAEEISSRIRQQAWERSDIHRVFLPVTEYIQRSIRHEA